MRRKKKEFLNGTMLDDFQIRWYDGKSSAVSAIDGDSSQIFRKNFDLSTKLKISNILKTMGQVAFVKFLKI
jgi:hypothetical protein